MLTSLAAGTSGDDGAVFRLTGRAEQPTCGLQVWIPGEAKPGIDEQSGLDEVELEQVDGGWILTGCADGDYALASAGPAE